MIKYKITKQFFRNEWALHRTREGIVATNHFAVLNSSMAAVGIRPRDCFYVTLPHVREVFNNPNVVECRARRADHTSEVLLDWNEDPALDRPVWAVDPSTMLERVAEMEGRDKLAPLSPETGPQSIARDSQSGDWWRLHTAPLAPQLQALVPGPVTEWASANDLKLFIPPKGGRVDTGGWYADFILIRVPTTNQTVAVVMPALPVDNMRVE